MSFAHSPLLPLGPDETDYRFITDAATDRLVAVSPGSGQVRLDVKSGAEVLGVTAGGVMLGRGRTIGYMAFSGSA